MEARLGLFAETRSAVGWGARPAASLCRRVEAQRLCFGSFRSGSFCKTPPLLQSLVEADWFKPSKWGKLKRELNAFTFEGLESFVVLGKPGQPILKIACCNFLFLLRLLHSEEGTLLLIIPQTVFSSFCPLSLFPFQNPLMQRAVLKPPFSCISLLIHPQREGKQL